MDNGNPEALAGLNGVLGLPVGAEFTFPDGANIPRHPEFYVIAAGNTGGHGADDRHVARVVLDGATLDRFTFITWDYDEALERAMVPAEASAWVDRVQALRKAAKAAGDALYITPRATERGARMLARGMAWDRVEAANIWKDVPDDTRRAVLAHV
jgi:hypothetical protein